MDAHKSDMQFFGNQMVEVTGEWCVVQLLTSTLLNSIRDQAERKYLVNRLISAPFGKMSNLKEYMYTVSKFKNAKFFAFHIDFSTQTCYYNYTEKRCRETLPVPLVFSRCHVHFRHEIRLLWKEKVWIL